MGIPKKKPTYVIFPKAVFETADTKEDLEDWLLIHDSAFIASMRKSRSDDLAGKGREWKEIKSECIR